MIEALREVADAAAHEVGIEPGGAVIGARRVDDRGAEIELEGEVRETEEVAKGNVKVGDAVTGSKC